MPIVAFDDVGKYVDDKDVGLYATQFPSTPRLVTGTIGIKQWGLAQFGTTGILGFPPTIFVNGQRLNVMKVI